MQVPLCQSFMYGALTLWVSTAGPALLMLQAMSWMSHIALLQALDASGMNPPASKASAQKAEAASEADYERCDQPSGTGLVQSMMSSLRRSTLCDLLAGLRCSVFKWFAATDALGSRLSTLSCVPRSLPRDMHPGLPPTQATGSQSVTSASKPGHGGAGMLLEAKRPAAIPGRPSLRSNKVADSGYATSRTLQPSQLGHEHNSPNLGSPPAGGLHGLRSIQVGHPAVLLIACQCQAMESTCLFGFCCHRFHLVYVYA